MVVMVAVPGLPACAVHVPVGFNYYTKGAELGRGAWLVDQQGMIGRCVSTRDLPDVLPNPGLARAPRPQQRR